MSSLPRSELRLRVASAAVGLPLLFLVLWAGGLVFAAVAVVAALIALREMLDLLRRARTIRGGGPVVLDGVRVLAAVACVACRSRRSSPCASATPVCSGRRWRSS